MRPGDEIVVTGLDHQANVDPWVAAARDSEVVVRTWEPRLDDCTLRLEDLDAVLNDRTRLVAVGWASNAVGTINPIAEIAERVASGVGAWLYVDAVHAAPHLRPRRARRRRRLRRLLGLQVLRAARRRGLRPARHPRVACRRTRSARPTTSSRRAPRTSRARPGRVAAVEYLADVGSRYGGAADGAGRRDRVLAGMRAIRAYELDLYRHLASRLGAIDGIRILGLTADADMDRRTPTAAISIAGVAPRAAAERLGERGIAVWDGDFYATGLMERLGLAPDGVLRIGLTHYNTRAEVDRLADELEAIAAA